MNDISVRRATLGDVEAITRIYNQGIEDRVATLETELRTPDERREWLTARGERHPVLVAERAGRLIAWASLNRFNPRPAYDHVADFSIYVDAPEPELETWYLDRFRKLRQTAFQDPSSYFHYFAEMTEEEAMAMAKDVWERVNLANLRENIAPTREKATLILEKGANHVVDQVLLRRL